MCSKERLVHLSDIEVQEVKSLLTEFKDIFSVSNDNIGCTSLHMFDINTNNLQPIADLLRRVPLHKECIVKELLCKYDNLGLIEKTDFPFRASTVLIEKKNVTDSADITDKYRLCVDYRSLNSAISDSGQPMPSIDNCLDATAGAKYLSAINFNSGYHQIPCTDRAKEALAFSPGYGFPQYTWHVMPQGVKPASHCFPTNNGEELL